MPMFDRSTCSIAKSQIGFIEFIIQVSSGDLSVATKALTNLNSCICLNLGHDESVGHIRAYATAYYLYGIQLHSMETTRRTTINLRAHNTLAVISLRMILIYSTFLFMVISKLNRVESSVRLILMIWKKKTTNEKKMC